MIAPEIRRKIRAIEIRTSRIVTDVLAGQYRSAFKGRGMEFEEVRPYIVGDDVRTIDWNVSARAGEPHVKVFREERELTVILAVDLSGSLSFGTRAEFKRELVAEVAATVAFSAIRSNDRVGMMLFTDGTECFVPPRKGGRHALRIVRDLLAYQPARRGTNLARAIDDLNASLSRRSVVVLASDFLSPHDADPWSAPLARLRGRHDVFAIVATAERERIEIVLEVRGADWVQNDIHAAAPAPRLNALQKPARVPISALICAQFDAARNLVCAARGDKTRV
ncbi:MAG: DUF58 domain-containing protein, partial [Phycisphaerales bacterium]